MRMDPDGAQLVASLPSLLPAGAPPAALVTVVAAQGSAPRGPGARMVVRGGKLLAGTIGGGHLEQLATDEASDLLAKSPNFQPVMRDWALGPALAQCCGGRVAVRLEPISSASARTLTQALNLAQSTDGLFQTGEGPHLLVERPVLQPSVVIFGAGHVARALAHVLAVHPWRVVVVDERPDWADPGAFCVGTEVRATAPLAALQQWGWLGGDQQPTPSPPLLSQSFAVIMTHDHELDRQIAWALLRHEADQHLPYVGVIGSKTKIATLHRRLAGQGITPAQLQHLTAPIGLLRPAANGQPRPIGGKRPGEIATSVAADLMLRIATWTEAAQ
ncbi:MAG: xanthine dehydrogenase accessory protein XdhC [Myxococcales bacterium]|nr:xanthine dehydrogenase accessory protein XdhC [Myxococcales bacterium]